MVCQFIVEIPNAYGVKQISLTTVSRNETDKRLLSEELPSAVAFEARASSRAQSNMRVSIGCLRSWIRPRVSSHVDWKLAKYRSSASSSTFSSFCDLWARGYLKSQAAGYSSYVVRLLPDA